jgi:hypothetical protein
MDLPDVSPARLCCGYDISVKPRAHAVERTGLP